MNYQRALDYLEEKSVLGSVPGLNSIIELMNRLGNPQDSLRFVHVAGSNGKGSVCAYLSAICKEAGIKACTYTSPAVFTYLERFAFNGKNISQKLFATLMSQVAEAADAMEKEGLAHPTVFEMETAVFFLFAKKQEASLCIMECGMGGLLDATNLVRTTAVCAFASISMDHMSYLGKSLADIAYQKAGILKEGAEAVVGVMAKEAGDVIREQCDKKGIPCQTVDASAIGSGKATLKGQKISYKERKGVAISLTGTYQAENAALAIEACLALRRQGYDIADEAISRGLSKTVWPGRLMFFPGKPAFLLDGAHNEDAARRLKESLELLTEGKRRILILGMFADKEYEKVTKLLAPIFDQIITITPPSPRALPSYELAQVVREINPHVTALSSPEEAMEVARMLADPSDIIVCCGSLSFLAKAAKCLQDKR